LDDEKRIIEDEKNSIDANQVLWDTTDKLHAGGWIESLDVLLAQYRIDNQNLPDYWSGGRLP
jgi:hypothetical protein